MKWMKDKQIGALKAIILNCEYIEHSDVKHAFLVFQI